MNRAETITAVIWLDQIAAKAKEEAAKLRADLSADARAEFEEQGTPPTWRVPDVATVSASVTHAGIVVGDERALARWVMSRYPTEVEEVVQVRSAWRTHLLAIAQPSGDVATLPNTGEVIPGLTVRAGGEFAGVTVRATPAAKAVYGEVAGVALRQLAATAGPSMPVVLAAELEAVQ